MSSLKNTLDLLRKSIVGYFIGSWVFLIIVTVLDIIFLGNELKGEIITLEILQFMLCMVIEVAIVSVLQVLTIQLSGRLNKDYIRFFDQSTAIYIGLIYNAILGLLIGVSLIGNATHFLQIALGLSVNPIFSFSIVLVLILVLVMVLYYLSVMYRVKKESK